MGEPLKILLVEDNPSDQELTLLAFERLKIVNPLICAEDGEEALDILESSLGALPGLILLDLNMPGMDGREFITTVKADPRFLKIPVVVLTSSGAAEDIDVAYRQHCAGYIRKPVDLEGLMRVVRIIDQYWFEIVALPAP